jgi:E3 ubiquitin-protein ligase HECTD2
VRQLFQPEYALVTWDENKTICWFSPAGKAFSYAFFVFLLDHICLFLFSALENESEFKLVGIVFGLAIYNSTILDVHFPPVIYSYLLNPEYIPTFEDLKVRVVSCLSFTLSLSCSVYQIY